MNRREFVSAAAAGLAFSALSRRRSAEEAAARRPDRLRLVRQVRLFRLIQVAPVEVVSLCDVDKTMLAEAAEMVAERQQSARGSRGLTATTARCSRRRTSTSCLVGTPDHWHALPMIAAVEAGADVYVQKPISVDVVEGQAMVAAARKHKRVVQVGTQRRSTPHLVEARDRVIKEGKLGKIGHRRDLLLLPHAGQRQPARCSKPPEYLDYEMWTGPRRCALRRAAERPMATSRCRTAAGGGPSWSTATASSATCASTCSTWSAGCSTSAGRSASARPAASSCRRTASRTSPTRRRPRSTSATSTSSGSTAPGATRPIPNIPGPAIIYGDKGTLKVSVNSYDFFPIRQEEADAERHAALRGGQVSRGQDREGPGAARRLGQPRRTGATSSKPSRDRGKAGRRHRAGPHLDRELHPGEPLDAARPLAHLGPGEARSRRRRRGEQAAAPRRTASRGCIRRRDSRLSLRERKRQAVPRR